MYERACMFILGQTVWRLAVLRLLWATRCCCILQIIRTETDTFVSLQSSIDVVFIHYTNSLIFEDGLLGKGYAQDPKG